MEYRDRGEERSWKTRNSKEWKSERERERGREEEGKKKERESNCTASYIYKKERRVKMCLHPNPRQEINILIERQRLK